MAFFRINNKRLEELYFINEHSLAQGSMNFEKNGSQQKRLVASKSCSHLPSFFKKIKFRHFEFLKDMYYNYEKYNNDKI